MTQRITSDGALQADLAAGTLIAGRYEIDRLIAKGGMGSVYLARQMPLNRQVALKTLRPYVPDDDQDRFTQRFRLEAEALAALKHPNIVTIYDYGETPDGQFFLAMEYVEGPRFNDLLKGGKRPDPARLIRLTIQVCSALQYAHNRGIIHRDIKLSNILIEATEEEEQVKVVDFGLVKLTDTDHDLTRAGTVLGSPHFMAPEQIKEEPVDHRVDIYAVGVMMFCGFTGKYPFHGQSKATTIAAHLARDIPTFESKNPELSLPPRVEETVRHCLAKAPKERFSDMGRVISSLNACLRDMNEAGPGEAEDTLRVSTTSLILPKSGQAIGAALVALMLMLGFAAIVAAAGFAIQASSRGKAPAPTTALQQPRPQPIPTATPKLVESSTDPELGAIQADANPEVGSDPEIATDPEVAADPEVGPAEVGSDAGSGPDTKITLSKAENGSNLEPKTEPEQPKPVVSNKPDRAPKKAAPQPPADPEPAPKKPASDIRDPWAE